MTTDTEEELFRNYQSARVELEEQEDRVKEYIRNGEDYTQELLHQVRQVVGKRERSMDSLMDMQRELQRNEANYLEELIQERKILIQQQDEAEYDYRKKHQELILKED
ncbi:hypothetical protein UAY_00236 [Enterococcus moraviensis ATCC BAA-383]|uniref:Uncharacterized protein n=1 Tax=Enterococcus moraviensis ATCC BAA-383 TaxID=1158609 RepID=R2TNX9_9ENTE|nr:hypothetical protein [Enterococcus moraviensis]EOI06894.1 hypothetical protein UAY_00236 [Enterococcus moraviensis ATCC BAA-383]EOT65237.1 hypothetical protein I586_02971 [Enterococcus moraviensis ATCC BAA-383]OJG64573.1 hypothetical protein RV09_GL001855 [Enterococcus moraviensis]